MKCSVVNDLNGFLYREMCLLGHQLENMPRCKVIFEKYTDADMASQIIVFLEN